MHNDGGRDAAAARGLKKRCGTALLDALDRAIGAAPEVHEWSCPPLDARVELPDRIEHVEACLLPPVV
jgi:protein ImuB